MAERDTYCGLCGAGLTLPLFRASGGEDESGPVAIEPGKEDTVWLAKVRILYQRTNLRTGSRRSARNQNRFRHDKLGEFLTSKISSQCESIVNCRLS